ncbi:uncharacterized protein LOC126777728 [Nymphalis io]|uniref:uncharacterized protein LOC126777728 n=1 Tax=Inachis io TaxID=171585 RepID=UPI00216A4791|nr:uncharacterized protein LOC126777728 [Nymphalis io]
MFLSSISKTVVFVFSLALASNIVYKFYHKKRKKDTPDINEVIMFCNVVSPLKHSKYSRSKISHNCDRLLHYINSPRYSVDVCMYVLTNQDIINILLKLHIRGIKVRLILDADMAFASGTGIKRFDKLGIPVRWMKSTHIMHHKFCLIDTLHLDVENEDCTPLMIIGSLNWTNQAVTGNWEDVIVTSQKDLIRQYQSEFEKLWLQFKPIVDSRLNKF